jgi:multicomponent K+:H+ antiporter subunit D
VIWGVVLMAALLMIVACVRAGSSVFWKTDQFAPAPEALMQAASAMPRTAPHSVAMGVAASAIVCLSLAAGPVTSYTQAAAAQLFERKSYISAVLQKQSAPPMLDVRKEMREWKSQGKEQ